VCVYVCVNVCVCVCVRARVYACVLRRDAIVWIGHLIVLDVGVCVRVCCGVMQSYELVI